MKQQYEQKDLDIFDPPRKSWKYRVCVVLGLLAACAAIASFPGCRSLKTIADKHPKQAAEYCAAKYPVKESTRTITKYLRGKPVPVPSEPVYVTVDCDSVVAAAKRDTHMGIVGKGKAGKETGKTGKVKIPVPTYLQVDTASTEEVIERENVAALAAKQIEIDDAKAKLTDATAVAKKATGNAVKWKHRAGYELGLLIGIVLCWIVYKLIKKSPLFKVLLP